MNRALLPLCLLFAAFGSVCAQEQEQGLLDRIDAKRKMAIQSMNGDGKTNPALSSNLGNKNFGGSTFETKKYGTSAYGTKSAEQKTYVTKSFFGIKNPWFGRTFETSASRESSQIAKEASQKYKTDAFAVSNYDKSGKKDLLDSDVPLPDSAQPRKYLGPEQPTKKEGIDKFTQNLTKELSIDDVRDLLNKGKSE